MSPLRRGLATVEHFYHLRGWHTDDEIHHESPTWITREARRIVRSPKFDAVFGALIVLNSFQMALSLELEGHSIGQQLGVASSEAELWEDWSGFFSLLTGVFAFAFSLELMGRVLSETWGVVRDPWNWLDLLSVLASLVDVGVIPSPDRAIPNLSAARALRLVQLTKVFRIVRVTQVFSELRLLVKTISASILSLAWSMVLLCTVMVIAAVFLGQLVQGHVLDNETDLTNRLQVFHLFGTFSRAFVTVFEITMAPGGWSSSGRLLTETVDRKYFIFYFTYVFMVSFAMIRVITAVFLKETLQVANRDHDAVVAEQVKKGKELVDRCRAAFKFADMSRDGFLTLAELQDAAKLPDMKAWLAANELDASEVPGVFYLLDVRSSGYLSFDEFVNGVTRLRGGAKQVDMVSLMYETRRIMEGIARVERQMGLSEVVGSQNPIMAMSGFATPAASPKKPGKKDRQ